MTRGLVCPCISYRSQGLVFDDPGNIITMSNKNYMVADWILKSRREAVVSAPLHRGAYTESTGPGVPLPTSCSTLRGRSQRGHSSDHPQKGSGEEPRL